MATHSSILAGKFHGQRSLAGLGPWGHKEADTTKRAHASTHTQTHRHTDTQTHTHTHTHTHIRYHISQPRSQPGYVKWKQTQKIGVRSQPKLTNPGSPWGRNVLTTPSSCPWTSYWCSHWPQQNGLWEASPSNHLPGHQARGQRRCKDSSMEIFGAKGKPSPLEQRAPGCLGRSW